MLKFKLVLFSILICYSKIVESVPFSDEPIGQRAIQPSDWLLRQNAQETNRMFAQTHEGNVAIKPTSYYENRGGQYDSYGYNGNQPSLPNSEHLTLNSMPDLHKLVNYGRYNVPTNKGSEYRDSGQYQQFNSLSQNQNIASNSHGSVVTDQERAILQRGLENYNINNFPHENIQQQYIAPGHYYQPKNEYLLPRELYKPIPENSRYVQPMPVNFQNPSHLTTYENPRESHLEAAQKSNTIRNIPHLSVSPNTGVIHNPEEAFRIQQLPLKTLPMYSVLRNNLNTAQVTNTAQKVLEEAQSIEALATKPNTFVNVPRFQQTYEIPDGAKVSEHNVIASNPVFARNDDIISLQPVLDKNYNTNNNIPGKESQALEETLINNAYVPEIKDRSNNFNKNNGGSVRITNKFLDEAEKDLEYAEDLLIHTKEVQPSYIYPKHEIHINGDKFGNNDDVADSKINQPPTDESNTNQDLYHHQLSLKNVENLRPENIMSDPQIKNILSKKMSHYVILYANGTVGYADDLESFKQNKNYLMINGDKIVNPLETNDDLGNIVPATTDSSTLAPISVENIISSTVVPVQNSDLEITNLPLAEINTENTPVTQTPFRNDLSSVTREIPSSTTLAPVVTSEDEIITLSPIEQVTDNVIITSSPTTKNIDNYKDITWEDKSTSETKISVQIKPLSTTTYPTSSKDITLAPGTTIDDQVITLSPIEQSTDNVSDGPLKSSPISDHYHKNKDEIWKDKSTPETQNPVHDKPLMTARPVTSKHITLAPATTTDDQVITLSPIEQSTDNVSDGPLKPSPTFDHYHKNKDEIWKNKSTPKTIKPVHNKPSPTTTMPVTSKNIALAPIATTDNQVITLSPIEQSTDNVSDGPLKPSPTSENYHKTKDNIWKDKPTTPNLVHNKSFSTITRPVSSILTTQAPVTDDQIITISPIEQSTDNVRDGSPTSSTTTKNLKKNNNKIWKDKSIPKPATISNAEHTTKNPISSLLDRKEYGDHVEVELITVENNKFKHQSGNQQGQGEDTIILDIVTDDNINISLLKNKTSSNTPKSSNSPSHTFLHSESSTTNTKDSQDHTKSGTPSSSSESPSDSISNSDCSRNPQRSGIKDKTPKISVSKNIEIDISNIENKPEVWFRTTDMDFFDKLNSKNDTFDVIYFIQMHNQMLVERDTKTTIYCNGSTLVEVTETIWDSKDDPSPKTVKTSQWIQNENGD